MHDDRMNRDVIRTAVAAAFERQAGRILVAVSGGVDSLALLLAAAEVASERTGVASLDHGLRPESAAEVERVRRARALARRCRSTPSPWGCSAGPGTEARARAARYAALDRIARAHGYAAIATAHTADDQAETLLMRLARGSALRGAAAIRAGGPRLLRPLLAVRRAADRGARRRRRARAGRATRPTRTRGCSGRASGTTCCRCCARPPGPPVVERLARFARSAAEDEELLAGAGGPGARAGAGRRRARRGGGARAPLAPPLPGAPRLARGARVTGVSDRLLREVGRGDRARGPDRAARPGGARGPRAAGCACCRGTPRRRPPRSSSGAARRSSSAASGSGSARGRASRREGRRRRSSSAPGAPATGSGRRTAPPGGCRTCSSTRRARPRSAGAGRWWRTRAGGCCGWWASGPERTPGPGRSFGRAGRRAVPPPEPSAGEQGTL